MQRLLLMMMWMVVLVVAMCGGWSEGKYPSCMGRGYFYNDDICVCHPGYHSIGLWSDVYSMGNSGVSRHGYARSCCRHCYCTPPGWPELMSTAHVGKRNHHADVRPLAIRDDREAVLQDMHVRRAVADDATSSNSRSHNNNVDLNIAVSLGAFDELQPRFPSCVVPGYDAEAQVTEEEGVALARSFVDGCASKWEWARQFHNPINHRAVVLAAWVTFRPDGQRNHTISCHDIGYIAQWYESVMTMGLPAILFHDCASPRLVDALTNHLVRFEKVQLDPSSDIHFKQSPNDVRFVLFKEYLDRSDAVYDFVLMTDLHDVRFRRDPFSAMRARPDIEIFIGADRYAYKNNPFTWEVLEWCAEAYGQLPYEPWFGDAMTLNCGVVGGKYDAVLRLLTHVVKLYSEREFEKHSCREPWQRYCDMAMFAIALMTGYETLYADPATTPPTHLYRYDSGPPFTSFFADETPSQPYYVIHK
ncbi:hypothetical protein PTSG_01920 [Salpingoeca rosetta]|uniref:Uncharacterized protein n=1 Tax=Salpingoeca rosetta (strain ATCC 50818 / BSB-021) TaxID=946362 RepID=F2TZC3_SALR5|nr:uncharacterized protein PTSG_01920 [Salpingoeca rosetta]EGD78947.1 hypothetical protein PTSG_01920 [Salpingoeca rosetta]|eukprot:XP_004997903.1 hypothetical protein PTSG_01920 [Salpingoeca rosetta]